MIGRSCFRGGIEGEAAEKLLLKHLIKVTRKTRKAIEEVSETD